MTTFVPTVPFHPFDLFVPVRTCVNLCLKKKQPTMSDVDGSVHTTANPANDSESTRCRFVVHQITTDGRRIEHNVNPSTLQTLMHQLFPYGYKEEEMIRDSCSYAILVPSATSNPTDDACKNATVSEWLGEPTYGDALVLDSDNWEQCWHVVDTEPSNS